MKVMIANLCLHNNVIQFLLIHVYCNEIWVCRNDEFTKLVLLIYSCHKYNHWYIKYILVYAKYALVIQSRSWQMSFPWSGTNCSACSGCASPIGSPSLNAKLWRIVHAIMILTALSGLCLISPCRSWNRFFNHPKLLSTVALVLT